MTASRMYSLTAELETSSPSVFWYPPVKKSRNRNVPAGEFLANLVLERGPFVLAEHQDREFRAVKNEPGPICAFLAESAYVIDPGRIDEKYGSERGELHGFFDGVWGGAGDVGNDDDVLSGEGVEQGGFPGVSSAEETDLETQSLRCVLNHF